MITFIVKFKFYLKSGKVFECVENLSEGKFEQVKRDIHYSMITSENESAVFNDCCVRLSECAVVEWEVLDNEQKE